MKVGFTVAADLSPFSIVSDCMEEHRQAHGNTAYTVEPLNEGHFGNSHFVLRLEVVLSSRRLKTNYCYGKAVQYSVLC